MRSSRIYPYVLLERSATYLQAFLVFRIVVVHSRGQEEVVDDSTQVEPTFALKVESAEQTTTKVVPRSKAKSTEVGPGAIATRG